MIIRHQGRFSRPHSPWLGAVAVVIAVLIPCPSSAQPESQEPQAQPVRLNTGPAVIRLPGERLVVDHATLEALAETPGQASAARRWLVGRGWAVLDGGRPGLVLHYHADGVEAMSAADLLWEGLPREAVTMQAMVDEVITRCREAGRPIARLTVTGHAGLEGCAAWGRTLDDCTFRGELTPYQRGQLRRLRPYLAGDAVIELRQCTTAGGQVGLNLLHAVHEASGAAAVSYPGDFPFGQSEGATRIRVDEQGVHRFEGD